MADINVTKIDTEVNNTIEELNETERLKYLPVTVVLVIIMCIGIIGNVVVLLIYKRKFKRSSARVYILSLAAADLTVCVFGIPYHVLDLTLIITYNNVSLCKVLTYFIGGFTWSSMFILLVVGLDRYLKVCRPLKRQIVDFGDRKACLLAVFVAMVISIPNAIIYGRSSVDIGVNNTVGVECFIDDEYQGSGLAFGYLGVTFLLCIIIVLLLIIMYSLIGRTIYKIDASSGEISLDSKSTACFCCLVENREEEAEGDIGVEVEQVDLGDLDKIKHDSGRKQINKCRNNSQKKTFNRRETMIRHSRKQREKNQEKNTRKITLMMMTITVVFIIAYLPFLIISILDNLDETLWDNLTNTKALLLDLLLRMYLLNNAANPIIYSFWDAKFRKETTRLFKSVFCCWKTRKTKKMNKYYCASSKFTLETLKS